MSVEVRLRRASRMELMQLSPPAMEKAQLRHRERRRDLEIAENRRRNAEEGKRLAELLDG